MEPSLFYERECELIETFNFTGSFPEGLVRLFKNDQGFWLSIGLFDQRGPFKCEKMALVGLVEFYLDQMSKLKQEIANILEIGLF
jgi:hypothetical protein